MSGIPALPTTQAADADIPSSRLNAYQANISFLLNPPCVKVRRTSTFSIGDSSVTAIQFGSEDYDTDVLHSNTTNTTRLSCPSSAFAGLWHVEGNVEWASGTTHYRSISIRQNGSLTLAGALSVPHASDTVVWRQHVSVDVRLAANDYVELTAYQNSGGALNVNGDTTGPTWFSMRWVGV